MERVAEGATGAAVKERESLALLCKLTDVLFRAGDVRASAEEALSAARELLGASRASLHLLDAGDGLSLCAAPGFPPEAAGSLGRVAGERPALCVERVCADAGEASLAALAALGIGAVLGAPIPRAGREGEGRERDGREVGWLAFYFEAPRAFEAETRARFDAVRAQFGGALERERDLWGAADGARFRALAQASRLFAQAGLALDEVLRSVVREVAWLLGDRCSLYLLSDDGRWLEAVAQGDRLEPPRAPARARRREDRWPVGQGLFGECVREGRSLFLPALPQGGDEGSGASPGHRWVDRHGASGLIAVPLLVQGRALGLLAATRASGAQRYTDEDRIFLESLADHAALAIDNARSFAAEQAATREATLARRWLERRQAATCALTAAARPAEVVDAVLEAAAGALVPESAAVCLLEEGEVRVCGSFRRQGGGVFEAPLPQREAALFTRAALEPDALYFEEPSPLFARWPDLEGSSARALAVVPLRGRAQESGALVLSYDRPRAFSLGERGFLAALGQQASVSLERAQLFAAVKAREEEALRVAEFQNQLLGIVGHDLRNPLAAIRMGAAVLARMVDGDERKGRLLARIISSTERSDRLIRELLDFTRARIGGGIPIERADVDLHALTRSIVDELEAAHPARVIRVEARGDVRGRWDAGRMAQVVSNLLTNALLYSPPESEVHLSLVGREDSMRITTHNFGEPIPDDRLDTVFEPFCRVDGRSDGSKSLGLGLYIVREIVRAHAGSVLVRSSREHGTEFTVEVPRRAPNTELDEAPALTLVEARSP